MLVLGGSAIRAVLKFNSAILADLAMRGCAISFLMSARVAISSLVCFFLLKIHPS
jgi:hypothetical protein